MTTCTRTITTNGMGMALHVGSPPAPAQCPAVVVIMHAPGVDTFIHAIIERLNTSGYVAAAPDLYHRQVDYDAPPLERMKHLRDINVMADVNAAIAHLREQPEVDPARVGILGFCMGGRVAYLMAAVNPDLRAAVVYYGGNIMVSWGEGIAAPVARTANINCPLLFHFGDEDTNPSPEDRATLDAELSKHGKKYEFHTYPNAGHAFMNFTNPDRYREAASEASWPRTIEFLERHLGS